MFVYVCVCVYIIFERLCNVVLIHWVFNVAQTTDPDKQVQAFIFLSECLIMFISSLFKSDAVAFN